MNEALYILKTRRYQNQSKDVGKQTLIKTRNKYYWNRVKQVYIKKAEAAT